MTTSKVFFLLFLVALTGLSTAASAQVNGSFEFEGQQRSYTAYVPADWTPADRWPLVFVLHGFTQTGQAIMDISGFNAVADTNRFICVYPNGINNGWNTNNPFPGSSTANDVGFILALADTLTGQYHVDPRRMYACGFSAGGFMSHKLACEASDRFAAIASVSGTMTSTAFGLCQPIRPMPVLQIHGTADGVVAYNGSFANLPVQTILDYWAGRDTCPAPPDTLMLPDLVNEGAAVQQIRYFSCADSTEVRFLKIINGGHTWPGGAGLTGIGNTNRDIQASREIWAFFSRFSLPGTSVTFEPIAAAVFQAFPNPTNDHIEVRGLDKSESVRLRLFDLRGLLLLETTGTSTLDLGPLPAGQYILYVQNGRQERLLAVQLMH